MIGASAIIMAAMLAGTPQNVQPIEPQKRFKAWSNPMGGAVELGRKWGVVTSVHRTPERNRAVGGMPNSYHLIGRAIDIARRPGVSHAEIAAAYRRAGYLLIESLDEGDHSHFAFGLGGSSPIPELAPPVRPRGRALDASLFAAICSAKPEAVAARRRPDRGIACADSPDPAPKLRPLEIAE